MDRATILRKIKACLRLAASSNPNEAAAAMRQAQAMMNAHGISQAEAMDLGEAEVGTRFRGQKAPQSIGVLASICAEGFGASMIIVLEWKRTTIRFYGADGAAEIAAYAFTVLRRQLERDRLKHVSRVRKRGNREARGEVFALAWVNAVWDRFPAAHVPEDRRIAVEQLMNLRHPSATTAPGRDLTTRGKTRDNDSWAGHRAGRDAQLHRGVGSPDPKALEYSA